MRKRMLQGSLAGHAIELMTVQTHRLFPLSTASVRTTLLVHCGPPEQCLTLMALYASSHVSQVHVVILTLLFIDVHGQASKLAAL